MSKWPDRLKLLESEQGKIKVKQRREAKLKLAKEKREKELYDRLHEGGDDDEQELTQSKSVSFLDPYSIQWMNRHRPLGGVTNGGASLMAHLTPAQALNYREIFNNLDFDGSGGISLEEMEEVK